MRNIKLIFAIFIVLNVVSCADGRQPVAVDANNQGDGALLTEDDFIGEVEMMLLLNACGRKAEAVSSARKVIEDVFRHEESLDYPNAINMAYTIIGLDALDRGDVELAADSLIKSAPPRLSPQISVYGPTFALAARLLSKGNRHDVIEYLIKEALNNAIA
jgi:PHD/YefM family antitoxin component YafN of YafNO toxin-antitoxin module